MTETNTAPAGGADAVVSVPVSTPAAPESFSIDPREAARQLSDWRVKQREEQNNAEPKAAPKAVAEAEPQESAQADDAPDESPAPVETTETAEPEESLPPIEPPRSWTKEEKEEFATYPREAQEKIARREQDREAALRRSQNEAAEARKGIDAERAKVEQVRQQYEAALPALLQTLQEQYDGEFPDIKTMADAERLAREDLYRYVRWDAQQKKLAAVTQEVNAAKARQEQDFKAKWSEFASKEDQLLVEKAPELADVERSKKVADSAVKALKDVGFSEQDLAKAWNGEQALSLRDHRLQLLILDAIKYREAKATASKPAPKTVPPVQRPGVSKPATSGRDAEIQALEKRLERTGSAKDATALLLARRRA